MSGYSNYGGSMGGGGGGGSYGRGGNKEVFDGKQLRRAVQRRTVDYNSSAMRWFLDRTWKNEVGEAPMPQPVYEASLDLVPPAAPIMKANPVTSVCTKFVHSSVNKPRCPINACRWTPEGKRLITGASTGEFTLWNGLTFNFETILQAHDSAVRSMIWSHNEYWMVTGDHQGLIKYWQSNMNNLKAFQAHEESIRDISFAVSDLKFASCSDDGAIKVWDFERVEEERTLKGHGWDVRCIDWHPILPIIASGSKDSLIKIWDAKSGKNLTTLHGHKNTIAKIKWNMNGNWLLTGSRDQLVKVFDIRTMKEFQTLRGHKREVTSMQWHPVHEDLFVSGAWDGAICYWVIGQDQPIASVTTAHQSSVWDLDWHPLGHILVSASNDHTTKFWTRNRPGDTMSDRYVNAEGKEEDPASTTSQPSQRPRLSRDSDGSAGRGFRSNQTYQGNHRQGPPQGRGPSYHQGGPPSSPRGIGAHPGNSPRGTGRPAPQIPPGGGHARGGLSQHTGGRDILQRQWRAFNNEGGRTRLIQQLKLG
ncbi:hypothetical protein NDN08_008287 [Rhodosorus marinus]|uniref:Anaphase-promoting complex subunit 4 WD40 domain-containing protein n=1 Tax=Rhodosorus marinus TaxID=101924 RepID=A0AAV8UZX6_9RHOD|nr:hypothetical protein NDN08_008287 [Rhodosorus marinus]